MTLFDVLGVSWPRDLPAWEAAPALIPPAAVTRALAMHGRDRAQAAFDEACLEGNPLTFPEVLTLQAGVTVGGRRVRDARQVLNLLAAQATLAALVRAGAFRLDKPTFDRLHERLTYDEAEHPGRFRGEEGQGEGRRDSQEKEKLEGAASPGGVGSPDGPGSSPAPWARRTGGVRLGGEVWRPAVPAKGSAAALEELFARGVAALEAEVASPLERGLAFALFAIRQRFYERGNGRAARLMASGVLLSHGLVALRVPAARQGEHARALPPLLRTGDGAVMMQLLVACQDGNGG